MPEGRLSRLLKAKLLRRSSTPADPKTANGTDPRAHPNLTSRTSYAPPHLFDSASDKSVYSLVSSAADHFSNDVAPGPGSDTHEGPRDKHRPRTEPQPSTHSSQPKDQFQHRHASGKRSSDPPPLEPSFSPFHTPLSEELPSPFETPLPTPQHFDDTTCAAPGKARGQSLADYQLAPTLDAVVEHTANERRPSTIAFPPSSSKRPSIAIRRQSLLPASHQHLISGLLEQSLFTYSGDQGSSRVPVAAATEMVQRRIWVKRPGASATLVPCLEDAVVDELRDQVIMKYANSLGRSFDSPDIVIRISAREGSNRQQTPERLLSPEEVLSSVLDSYYPGGQTVEEALLIEAPTRRTPKPSPRHPVYLHHHSEPGEHGEYFPLMPPNGHTPPAHPPSSGTANAPSISILTTGVAPALPSPGTRASRHHRRPPLTRHATNSPTMLGQPPTLTGTIVSRKMNNDQYANLFGKNPVSLPVPNRLLPRQHSQHRLPPLLSLLKQSHTRPQHPWLLHVHFESLRGLHHLAQHLAG